ncbi:unnamed protein product [Staurois parvus]|uniref:Uncharacterized protein n=1 Tax=Staurois parvus TaxID=386267 RepID=A0ABN9FKB0_9NEOB|nr:unnamed protein product [Staurois parvus]
MYINGQTGAVQERMAIYKHPLAFPACARSLGSQSLVPCDLCDHSQISLLVSNDVRSDILLTTIHVITDWPISDHMIGTSHRGHRIAVPCALRERTQAGNV